MNSGIFRMPGKAAVSSNILGLQKKLVARLQVLVLIMNNREMEFKITPKFQSCIKFVKTDFGWLSTIGGE